eukprot:scaffold94526_cov63-Phaeocystis_antarctica.AAC.3
MAATSPWRRRSVVAWPWRLPETASCAVRGGARACHKERHSFGGRGSRPVNAEPAERRDLSEHGGEAAQASLSLVPERAWLFGGGGLSAESTAAAEVSRPTRASLPQGSWRGK